MDFGCYLEGSYNEEELVKTCMLGTLRDWNFVMEYVQESALIKYLSVNDVQSFTFYVFDPKTQSSKLSKSSNNSYSVLGLEKYGSESQFLSKGEGSLVFQWENLLKSEGWQNDPAMFLKLRFSGKMSRDPELFEMRDRQNTFVVVGTLRSFRSGRSIELTISGTSITHTSNLIMASD